MEGEYAMKGNYTYRIRYAKTCSARYISQLDFVRVLSRTLRRADLPVTYTMGFNPHPVMTVALPIAVGVTSEDEYVDIDFDVEVGVDELLSAMRENLPKGIQVLAGKRIGEGDISFKQIDAARYQVELETRTDTVPDLDAFFSLPELVVDKKSKSGVKPVDIKKDIKELRLLSHDANQMQFDVIVPAGNTYNLKPELVFLAMQKYLKNFEIAYMQVHRTQLLAGGKRLISL